MSDILSMLGSSIRYDEPPAGLSRSAIVQAIAGVPLDSRPFRVPDWLTPGERIEIIAEYTRRLAHDPRFIALGRTVLRSKPERAQLPPYLLAWAQKNVRYVEDPENEEWYQGPLWTLEHGGDCEEYAVIVGALFLFAGFRAGPFWLQQDYASLNHVTAVVELPDASGRGFHHTWAEGSIPGARLGEHPWDAAKRTEHMHRLGG